MDNGQNRNLIFLNLPQVDDAGWNCLVKRKRQKTQNTQYCSEKEDSSTQNPEAV